MATPKTDAAASFIKSHPNSGEGMEVVDADFARQLESQVQELREALWALMDAEEQYGDETNVAINEAWIAARAVLDRTK